MTDVDNDRKTHSDYLKRISKTSGFLLFLA